MDDWAIIFLGGVFIGCIVMGTLWIQSTLDKVDWQAEAVKHHAAERVVVDDTGKTEFRWRAR